MIRPSRALALRLGATATAVVLVLTDSAAFAVTPIQRQPQQQACKIPHATQRMPAAAQSPDAIRGLKWRGAWRGPRADALHVSFDTRGLSYSTAVASLSNNNFRTVALRVANMTDLPDGSTTTQRDDEVMKLLRELNRRDVNVYLYKRQWLQRRDVSWGEYTKHPGAYEFICDMSSLINRARNEGISRLQGVMPIETNLNNTAEVRERALHIARGINENTDGWLKTHTLMVPGAGMGPYFRNIHQGGRAWLSNMESQTGHFAFIYKHMRSQDGGVNTLERLNARWDYYVGRQARTTTAQQVNFLRNDVAGVADLERYVHYWKRNGFPNHTDVVFWGDTGDGISSLSLLNDRRYNYNTARALHQLLVKKNRWHGYFFDFPFAQMGATGQDLWRYQIIVGPQGTRARNTARNFSDTHTVWDEWHNWASENFSY